MNGIERLRPGLAGNLRGVGDIQMPRAILPVLLNAPGIFADHGLAAAEKRAESGKGRRIAGEPDGYQELSINIDTGGLAARRLLATMADEGAGASVGAR